MVVIDLEMYVLVCLFFSGNQSSFFFLDDGFWFWVGWLVAGEGSDSRTIPYT